MSHASWHAAVASMQPVRPAAVHTVVPKAHRHKKASVSLVSSQTNGAVHSAVLQQKPQRFRLAQNCVPAVAETQSPSVEHSGTPEPVSAGSTAQSALLQRCRHDWKAGQNLIPAGQAQMPPPDRPDPRFSSGYTPAA